MTLSASLTRFDAADKSARRPISDRRWTLILFIVGWLSGLLWIVTPTFYADWGFSEEERVGLHISEGHGFLSPFDLAVQAPPTSWNPPVYPMLVGLVYHFLGGRSDAALTVLLSINMFARGLTAGGIFMLARLRFGKNVGLLAASLFLIHPMFLRLATYFWDNTIALALFTWLLVLASLMREGMSATWGRMTALGVGLGALVLTSAAYAIAVPVIVLYAVWNRLPGDRFKLAFAGFFAFGLVLVPWTARNYDTFHKLFFVRDNVGVELWLGNQSISQGWMCMEEMDAHPSRDKSEQALILKIGETKYFRLCEDRFKAELAAGGFWHRTMLRTVYVFLSDPTVKVNYPFVPNFRWQGFVIDRLLINSLLIMLGFAGLWCAHRLGYHNAWLLILIVLMTAPFAISHVHDRYAMPIRMILILFAAFTIMAVHTRLKTGEWPNPSLTR